MLRSRKSVTYSESITFLGCKPAAITTTATPNTMPAAASNASTGGEAPGFTMLKLPGEVKEFAMKKYKCHRTMPTQLLNEVTADLKKKKTALELRLEQGRGKAVTLNAKLIKIEGVLEAMSGLAAAPLAAGPP